MLQVLLENVVHTTTVLCISARRFAAELYITEKRTTLVTLQCCVGLTVQQVYGVSRTGNQERNYRVTNVLFTGTRLGYRVAVLYGTHNVVHCKVYSSCNFSCTTRSLGSEAERSSAEEFKPLVRAS